MRWVNKYYLQFLIIISGSFYATYLWFRYPDYFFTFPEPFVVWLINFTGSSNDEELTDIMFFIIFIISFLVIFSTIKLGVIIAKKLTR